MLKDKTRKKLTIYWTINKMQRLNKNRELKFNKHTIHKYNLLEITNSIFKDQLEAKKKKKPMLY